MAVALCMVQVMRGGWLMGVYVGGSEGRNKKLLRKNSGKDSSRDTLIGVQVQEEPRRRD
jgi:hypothetical protein